MLCGLILVHNQLREVIYGTTNTEAPTTTSTHRVTQHPQPAKQRNEKKKIV